MKKLLIYLKNYKKETVLAPLFKMLEACFELIVPLVVATIIDKGIKFNNTSVILTNCGVLVLLAVVGMVAAISAQYFAAKAATGFSTQLRYSLFEKINTFYMGIHCWGIIILYILQPRKFPITMLT